MVPKSKLKKVDSRGDLKQFYTASAKEPRIINVPKMNFLVVGGTGDPNAEEFHNAVDALYNFSYTLKFLIREELLIDFQVMHLEGLWWTGKDESSFKLEERGNWNWTAMIMQPEFVTNEMFSKARLAIEEKKRENSPSLNKVRLETFAEGMSAQILHVGPYSTEGSTIEKLHGFILGNGYKLRGKHHEIYLGDPRRASPSKLRTILRQPLGRA